MLGGVVLMSAAPDPGAGRRLAPVVRRRAAAKALLLGAALLGILLATTCSRPSARPRDGALPWLAGTPSGHLAELPPTLEPAANLRATPTVPPPATATPTAPPTAAIPAHSPAPSIYPLITNLQPAPGAAVPPGDVVVGARVSGASNLVEVATFVDGERIEPLLGSSPGRTVVIRFVRELPIGMHEVRVEARDEQGQSGSYRWFFSVGPRQPLPTIAAATMVPLPRTPTPEVPEATPTPP